MIRFGYASSVTIITSMLLRKVHYGHSIVYVAYYLVISLFSVTIVVKKSSDSSLHVSKLADKARVGKLVY